MISLVSEEYNLPFQALARPDIGIQVKLLTQGQVQGTVALTDRGHQRTLKADFVLIHGVNRPLRNAEFAIWSLKIVNQLIFGNSYWMLN